MKNGKQINYRLLYSLITLGILSLFSVSVYATQQTTSGGGTHSYAEIGLPSCKDGQVLKWNNSAWGCGNDTVLTKKEVQEYSEEVDTNSWPTLTYMVYNNTGGHCGGGLTLSGKCTYYDSSNKQTYVETNIWVGYIVSRNYTDLHGCVDFYCDLDYGGSSWS